MKIAYFDSVAGASGDMILGALIDAGWAEEELRALPRRLGLDGVEVEISRAHRGPLEAARIEVRQSAAQPERHLSDIRKILEGSDLPERVVVRALRVFETLADAEAHVHGSTRESVHFHEVGAADAIVDIAGACLGLENLGIEQVYASPLPLGRGTVRAAHGVIPVPAPATARLLRGVPVEMPDIEAELVTPTGAALLVTWVERWGGTPAFRVLAEGVGAGRRELAERPNVLRVYLGETALAAAPAHGANGDPSAAAGGFFQREVVVLETAIDDAPPQHLAPLLPKLLSAGARDAFLTSIVMKKGRPALLLTCLGDPGSERALADLIFRGTPTLGIRVRREQRFELARRQVRVETEHGTVEAKVATLPDGSERLMPEYESLAQVAESRGVSLLELSRLVTAAWESGP